MQETREVAPPGTILISCKFFRESGRFDRYIVYRTDGNIVSSTLFFRIRAFMSMLMITCIVTDEYGVWNTLVHQNLASSLPWKEVQFQTGLQATEPRITVKELTPYFIAFDSSSHRQSTTKSTFAPAIEELHLDRDPLVHLYCLKCEDIGIYKQIIKPRLQAWIELISKDSALILLLTESSPQLMNYRHLKGSLFDRLRRDLLVRKDQLVQIRISHSMSRPTWKDESTTDDEKKRNPWNSLAESLKRLVMSLLDRRILLLQDIANKLYLQLDMPGWNYLKYFSVMEEIGKIWEHLKSHEQALVVYDGLALCFKQILPTSLYVESPQKHLGDHLPSTSLPFYLHGFISSIHKTDSQSVLHMNDRFVNQLIQSNNISLFDLLCYFFYKQSKQLIGMTNFVELLQRAIRFLLLMRDLFSISRISSEQFSLFIDSWTFNFCEEIRSEMSRCTTRLDPSCSIYLGKLVHVQLYLVGSDRRICGKYVFGFIFFISLFLMIR